MFLTEAEKLQQVAKIQWSQKIEEKEAQKKISEIEGKSRLSLNIENPIFIYAII